MRGPVRLRAVLRRHLPALLIFGGAALMATFVRDAYLLDTLVLILLWGALAGAWNVAGGYATASSVCAGWMKSTEHRRNILNPDNRYIGTGYAAGGRWRHSWVWRTMPSGSSAAISTNVGSPTRSTIGFSSTSRASLMAPG